MHVAGSPHVGDEHQVEVGVAVHGEPHPSSSPALDPAAHPHPLVSMRRLEEISEQQSTHLR